MSFALQPVNLPAFKHKFNLATTSKANTKRASLSEYNFFDMMHFKMLITARSSAAFHENIVHSLNRLTEKYFYSLKEFLPQSYARVKNIEKKVFAEHRKHIGLSELDAKVSYTKTARELPTYGVTFFLVKEKMHGKNKLVPRLLGVTKSSVLRLDERTKEILKTWPLTTVRRWGASPNTFTLDFGDYADQYYSVQTTEAEQIVQLIAGYIDIILKKKQNKDHFGIDGDEGSTMVEESVAPSKYVLPFAISSFSLFV